MKKIIIEKPGGYEHLQLREVADLSPGADEVCVQLAAAGINYADCLVRWGVYASAKKYVGWPITPGFEFSGHVLAVGKNCQKYKAGDAVYGVTRFNAYASQVVVPEKQLYLADPAFDLKLYAGFPAVFFTAHHAMLQITRILKGSHILVHSAAGGVGSALVQLARVQGLEVTGVVGSSAKIPYLQSLGVNHVIDKSKENLWQRARSICPPGFDAVFDANGYSTFLDSYRHLRPTGKLICYGSHSLLPKGSGSGRINYVQAAIGLVKTPRFNPLQLINDNKSVLGFNLSFLFERTDLLEEIASDYKVWLSDGRIKPIAAQFFPLAEVAKAHQALESGLTTGKLILTF